MTDIPPGAPRGRALRDLARAFAAAGVETPALDARLLLLRAADLDHAALVADPDIPLTPEQAGALSAMARRRLRGEPVSRILGRREFYGRRFLVTPDTLDPRPDTETLVEAALAIARRLAIRERPLRVADVGTGSGAIVISLLAELPAAAGLGLDISAPALAAAAENARRLGVSGRLLLARGRWLEAAGGPFDIIVSNPPYIPSRDIAALAREVREHDPRLALDGGDDGLAAFRAIAAPAARALRPGGFLALEVGKGQAGAVREILAAAGFVPDAEIPAISRDLAGAERVVALRTPGGGSGRVG